MITRQTHIRDNVLIRTIKILKYFYFWLPGVVVSENPIDIEPIFVYNYGYYNDHVLVDLKKKNNKYFLAK